MTVNEAYRIHAEQAIAVANLLKVPADEILMYAFSVQKIENRSYNPNAKNKNSTARGMMQMLEGTQKEVETKFLKLPYSPDKIYDPSYAVFLGQYELVRQYKRYGKNWRKAVHAYNQGSYQESKSNTKIFKNGELYANRVLNELNSTDFAALNQTTGVSVVAANTTGNSSTQSLSQEWT